MAKYDLPSEWVLKRYNKDLVDGKPEMIQAVHASGIVKWNEMEWLDYEMQKHNSS